MGNFKFNRLYADGFKLKKMIASLNSINFHAFLAHLNTNTNRQLCVKIVSVAAASLAFFVIQWNVSFPLGCALALTISSLTFFSEKVIRPLKADFPSSNWATIDFNKMIQSLRSYSTLIYLACLAIFIYGSIFHPLAAVQAIELAIKAGNLKAILTVLVIGPIAEEILFRGFLQERLEDLLILVDRFVIQITGETIEQIASFASNIFFGAIHIVGNQVLDSNNISVIFYSVTLLGLLLSHWKQINEGSLLPSMGLHIFHNSFSVANTLLPRN